MSGPWERYQNQSVEEAGPWSKFQETISETPVVAPQPPKMRTSRAMNVLGSGATRGLANMAGMPVDIGNSLMGLLGFGSDKPIGGSQRLIESLGDLGAFTKPEGTGEQIIGAIGEQAPYAIPGIGAAGRVGNIGKVIQQAAKPVIGAGVASGLTRSVTDSPYADMAAQVAGAITGAGAPGTLQNILANTKLPEKLMASAIKMPLSRKWTQVRGPEETSQVQKAVAKAIEERVRPSEFGQAKVKSGRRAAGEQISEEISKTEGTASLDDIVFDGVTEARKRAVAGENVEGELAAIGKWEEAYKSSRNGTLTPKEMQTFKLELDKRINWDKISGKGDPLVDTMRKGVRHELRTVLEELNPGLKKLNESDQAWILLDEALDRSLARGSNRDIVGLGTKVLLGKGSWPFAIINATIGHPQVKATVAFALDKARQNAKMAIKGEPAVLPSWPQGGLDKTWAETQNRQWNPEISGLPNAGISNLPVPTGIKQGRANLGETPIEAMPVGTAGVERGTYPMNPADEAQAIMRQYAAPAEGTPGYVRGEPVDVRTPRERFVGALQGARERQIRRPPYEPTPGPQAPLTTSTIQQSIGLPGTTPRGTSLLTGGAGTTPKELLSSPEKIVVRGQSWDKMAGQPTGEPITFANAYKKLESPEEKQQFLKDVAAKIKETGKDKDTVTIELLNERRTK